MKDNILGGGDAQKGFTKKRIQEAVNLVFNQREPTEGRQIVFLRGCINTPGGVDGLYNCGDPDCPGCSNMNKLMVEEIQSQIEEHGIFAKIEKETDRQDQKWGVRNSHPLAWLAILTEEVGEVAQEINDAGHNVDQLDLEKYETELVQCAAVIVQMIKNIKHYRND